MIEKILKEKTGLSTESIGRRKIDADVEWRMRECSVTDIAAYEELLEKSQDELDRLIETVTVPETWFFRMKCSFEYLESFIKNEWMGSIRNRKIRILSIPCATGEEPYSIALTLLDCGLPKELFTIDAADINSVCVQRAIRGIYTKNSFRGLKQDFTDRHFSRSGASFEIKSELRQTVNFFRKNALELQNHGDGEKYDIIFCRNMLIYMDAETQARTIAILSNILNQDGLLFLGHSEAGVLFNTPFKPIEAKGAFAFRRTAEASPSAAPAAVRAHSEKAGKKSAAPAPGPLRPEAPKPRDADKKIPLPETRKEQPGERGEMLLNAEKLADTGKLKEAEEICKEYISVNKLDPKAHFLMGMLLMASRRYTGAEAFFHKALYIRPDYYEALMGISTIKEHEGDLRAARAFRERADRSGGNGL